MPFMALAGSALGAASSVMGGIAGQNMYDYQAEIAERNAQVYGMEGAAAMQAGWEKASERSLAGAQELGQKKTAIAAGGVDIHSKSPTDVFATIRSKNVLASATDLWNAQMAQWGYAQQAIGQEEQAQADKMAGQNAMMGGILGGASSLLSGLGNLPTGGMFGGSSGAAGAGGAGAGVGTGFLQSATPVQSDFSIAGASFGPDWTDFAAAHSGFA